MGAIWLALIAAIPPTVAAVAALVVSIQSDRKITEVHLSINGRLTELLEANRVAAHAEGRQAERDDEAAKANSTKVE